MGAAAPQVSAMLKVHPSKRGCYHATSSNNLLKLQTTVAISSPKGMNFVADTGDVTVTCLKQLYPILKIA